MEEVIVNGLPKTSITIGHTRKGTKNVMNPFKVLVEITGDCRVSLTIGLTSEGLLTKTIFEGLLGRTSDEIGKWTLGGIYQAQYDGIDLTRAGVALCLSKKVGKSNEKSVDDIMRHDMRGSLVVEIEKILVIAADRAKNEAAGESAE